jgi:hypothetical protein
MPRKTVWFPMLVALLGPIDLAAVGGQSATTNPIAVLRAVHPELRRLIVEGHERSTTFRRLIEDVRQSGWLVFVQAGRCSENAAVACLLHFVGAYDGAPYMRVVVTHQRRHPDDVIATLAHELQHVWEVMQEPGVSDARTMRALFQRIGTVSVQSATGTTYETATARATGERVLRELRRTGGQFASQ